MNLLAQGPGVASTIVEQAPQWTALTFLGVAFLFLIWWLVRNINQEFIQIRKQLQALQIMVLEDFRLLIMHDAQIRGVNPSAGSTSEESYQRAKEVYDRVLLQLNNIEHAVNDQKEQTK